MKKLLYLFLSLMVISVLPHSGFAAETESSWWTLFNDSVMNQLIRDTLDHNKTLEAAYANINKSRALLGVEKASLYPTVDSTNIYKGSRIPEAIGGAGKGTDLFGLDFDASWEIDIFGSKRSKIKSKKLSLEADTVALEGSKLSLTAETARDYILLRTSQKALEIENENREIQSDTVEIEKSKVAAGLSDELTLQEAKTVLEETNAAIPLVEADIENLKNALAVLTGRQAGELHTMLEIHKPIPTVSKDVYSEIPVESLKHRPDIREAEIRLEAQKYIKRSAEADLYPKFYITGLIGTEAVDVSDLFLGPAKWYSILPQISLPIFHGGALKNKIKAEKAEQERMMALYENLVLKADAEVKDCIIALQKEYERYESIKKAYDAAQESLRLAKNKYEKGLEPFLTVIAAEKQLLNISEKYVKSQGAISEKGISLFKALGGNYRDSKAVTDMAEVKLK